jgi:hypothetical protein
MSAFSLRLPDEFKAEVEAYAARVGISAAGLCAIALREYLDARGPAAPTPARQGGSAAVPRVGANQPCPCGSRKPYGKCHGREGGVP